MVKAVKYFVIAASILSMVECEYKTPFCAFLTDDKSVALDSVKLIYDTNIKTNWGVYFNPLVLPVSIRYTSASGFQIYQSDEQKIITPIGVVGVFYSVASQKGKSINGVPIGDGDFVVGLVNKKTSQKKLFKIEGHNRLKIITDGLTQIDAQSGYVEIDVTDASVRTLSFIDTSKATIINETGTTKKILFGMRNNVYAMTNWAECEIAPHSYKIFPRVSTQGDKWNFDMDFVLKVPFEDSKNGASIEVSQIINLGDVCRIENDIDDSRVKLVKM